MSAAKNNHPVTLLSVVRKIFEPLVNNRLVDHFEKYGPFSIASMISGLLDKLQILTVVSDNCQGFLIDLGW